MKTKKGKIIILALLLLMASGAFAPTKNIKACKCVVGGGCSGGFSCDWDDPFGNNCSDIEGVIDGGFKDSGHTCYRLMSLSDISVCLIDNLGSGRTCVDTDVCTAAENTYKYCTETKCGTYYSGGLINDSSTNSARCFVTTFGKDTCGHTVEGNWDNSEKKCVDCSTNNEEIGVAGDSTANYVVNFGGSYIISAIGTGKADNEFESACGAEAACDEKKEGDACGAGKECNESGACVLVAGLSLSASASPTTIAPSGSSTIAFKVTDASGSGVGGETVTASVIAGGGGVAPGSCTTGITGQCTVNYNAPAVSTVATIKGEIDDGSANVNVTVSSCAAGDSVDFGSSSYSIGESLDIDWKIAAANPDNDYVVCIYDESGNDVWDKNIAHFSGGANIGTDSSVTADAAGTWVASLSIGISCPKPPDGCLDSATVNAGPCADKGDACAASSDCCVGLACNTALGVCVSSCPTPLNCVNTVGAGDVGCRCGTAFATGAEVGMHCCSKDNTFYGTLAECNASACGGGGGCDYDDTKEAGEACDGPDLAGEDCVSLGFTGGTLSCVDCLFDTSLCTGGGPSDPVCDPGGWYFCNPLEGTVGTIVEAGETLLGFILGLIGSIALLFIIIAGIMYMTSAGNEERISSSKRVLNGAVIGLAIALLAYGLLQVVITVLGA